MSAEEKKKTSPSAELEKSIELWLKWDQCQSTRKEIEQLKVFHFFSSPMIEINHFLLLSKRMKINGMI